MMLSKREARTVDPVRLGICRGGTYGLFAAPEPIVAPARRLGAAVVRINLFWSQLEPAPGQYDWTALDTFLDQLHGDVQAWITVAGSSTWGSRISTPFLPPSPANDRIAYAAFVRLLVSRAVGRVAYWQCEIEPCVPLMWSGTAQDYLGQLHVFSEAVRAVDTTATVVLGGAVPMAMVADAPGSNRQAADDLREIVHGASGLYDVFDLHPYGDPYAIPSLVAAARSLMAEAG
ncbi:MAG TPA: beta-galactosidase, partial [Microlunatus sp.]